MTYDIMPQSIKGTERRKENGSARQKSFGLCAIIPENFVQRRLNMNVSY